ncbi:MAG: outer membrane lipoprotein-sorting protein [Desulfobacteraceae bacterium]|nr:outer membrane lipoprotein-sorting protein [Desulfobacteraceae bacterium]
MHKYKLKRFQRKIYVALIVFLSLYIYSTTLYSAEISEDKALPDFGPIMVKKAFDYYRGIASVSIVDMTVHRSDWERTVKIKAWTQGEHDSLFKILSPAKDKGNGTLKKGDDMWTFNPKVNRVIKLPPSMMSQAWMGSDFSNNDLAKSDTIVRDYVHTISSVKESNGFKIYSIESIPHPQAPVVWGMLKFEVREDGIMLSQGFYDEDKFLVKELVTSDIKMMGGKLFPSVWKISKTDEPDEYTTLKYFELEFKGSLPSRIFSKAGLKKR